MPKYYPVNLDLQGKKCVVIGGGEVAQRKVETLLEVNAEVLLVSPAVTGELDSLAKAGRITYCPREYQTGDLSGAAMAFGATDNQPVNRQVASDAAAANILFNIVDQPQLCNFIVPASVVRGELVISISTGGCSPALARHIRQELEKQFGKEYGALVEVLGNLRERVLGQVEDIAERRKIFHRLADSHSRLLELIRRKDEAGFKSAIAEITGLAPSAEERLFPPTL